MKRWRRNSYGVPIWWLQWEIKTKYLWAFADPHTGHPVWKFKW